MEGRGTIFLGVIPFKDFGCGRDELGVMVVVHFFFHVEINHGMLITHDCILSCLRLLNYYL
jgi:hypothetical protein